MSTGKKYSREFKIEAVELLGAGKTMVQVAKDLGISDVTLAKWKKKLKAEPENAFPGKGNMLPQDAELRRLQREIARLRMEKDILKKAIAMFSDPRS
jgi:transposase